MAKSKENESKQMDKMADQVAKKVMASLSTEPSNGNNGAGSFVAPDLNFAFADKDNENTEEAYSEQLAETIGFDIFDFCDKVVKQGDQIKYEIRKNGEMLATKVHPYSWERLQKDYGAGSYQVTARSMITRKYVKHETRPVANIDGSDTPFQRPEENQEPKPQAPGFMEMFSLMNNVSEKSKAEAREMAREQASASNVMMQGFIAMMQNSSTQAQQMFLEMSKLNMNVAEKLTEVTNKMFEKMEDRFEKIVEKLGKNKGDDNLGVLQLMQLTENAQKKGFDMFDKISKIAEAKADEKLEMLEQNRDTKARGDKSSIVDRLVDNVLPTITNAISEQQKRDAQQRRFLPRSQQLNPSQAPRFEQRARVNPSPTNPAPEKSQVQTNSEHSGANSGKVSEPSNITMNEFGLPRMNVAEPVIPTKTSIEEWLVPVMGKCLLKLESTETGAKEIIKVLQENKIPVKLFLDVFKKEDATPIVEKYGLPKEAVVWFEGVYANIEAQA